MKAAEGGTRNKGEFMIAISFSKNFGWLFAALILIVAAATAP
jgi:hypothetical protein